MAQSPAAGTLPKLQFYRELRPGRKRQHLSEVPKCTPPAILKYFEQHPTYLQKKKLKRVLKADMLAPTDNFATDFLTQCPTAIHAPVYEFNKTVATTQ